MIAIKSESAIGIAGIRKYKLWNRGWAKADQATIDSNRNAGIDRIMKYQPPSQTDTYGTEHSHRP